MSANYPIYPDDDPRHSPRWYAVYTRPKHEKKVYEKLTEQNIEAYVPLQKSCRQWSDRKKWIKEPLIKGYVFVRIPLTQSLPVLQIYGTVRFVTFNRQYAPIPDFQIDALKKTLNKQAEMQPSHYFRKGELVEVTRGSLRGVVGKVQDVENERRFVISLDAIQTSYRVQVDFRHLKPLSDRKKKKISLPLGIDK